MKLGAYLRNYWKHWWCEPHFHFIGIDVLWHDPKHSSLSIHLLGFRLVVTIERTRESNRWLMASIAHTLRRIGIPIRK